MSVEDLHPWFVGAYAENHKILEELILEMLRDHVFWRRNFHPESAPPIPTSAQYREDYADFVARLQHELYRLSADLKRSIPFFSPRYIGHMASDLLLPGLIARIATELYNPNNVTEDVSPVTLSMEVLVGQQLAVMLGYNVEGDTVAFGHMTSGGTVANYEGLRNLLAARLYPLAVDSAARAVGVDLRWRGRALHDYSPRRLANLSVDDAVDLLRVASTQGPPGWMREVDRHRYEALGLVEFARRHPHLGRLRVMVAATGHYSWAKAMKLLGLGTDQLTRVPVDASMRLDAGGLEAALGAAREAGDTVIAVVPILGNTEFGSIDPVHEVVALRETFRERGYEFGIHVDAAWGGYLRTLFKTPQGELRGRELVAADFRYFPSSTVYDAFMAVSKSDSATVDPHKLGFIPYSAGAYVARNREITEFVRQDAAYVFYDGEPDRYHAVGRFALEGSRPGAAVASAYVTHRTIPLDSDGFGKIVAQSIRSCEEFWDQWKSVSARLSDRVHIIVPFEPDTNLVCIAVNPVGNRDVAECNAFTRSVMQTMGAIDSDIPVRDIHFFVSSTKLFQNGIGSPTARRTLDQLGLAPDTFGGEGADHLLVMRHTLMNPWLLSTRSGSNYITQYFAYLESRIVEELEPATA